MRHRQQGMRFVNRAGERSPLAQWCECIHAKNQHHRGEHHGLRVWGRCERTDCQCEGYRRAEDAA